MKTSNKIIRPRTNLLSNDTFTEDSEIEESNMHLLASWVTYHMDEISNSMDAYNNEYLGV